jgi:diguanylate cyclase (GGDEF)-like protein
VWRRLSGELLVLTPLLVNAVHYGLMVYEPPSWWGPYPDTSFSHTISHALSQVENTIAARDYALQLEGQVKARTAALEAQVAETLKAEQALRVANASLQHTAFHDGLTQLSNRRAFDTHFEAQWSQHIARQRPLSVLMCDVDHFKKYNDLHGHVAGDECLRQIAQALRSAVRGEHDIVARYGGEEFVLVLPSTDLSLAVVVADRIQQEVRKLRLPHGAAGAGDQVTVSIGVATTVPRSDVSMQSLIELADHCLYQAKSAGRARCMSAEMG